MEFVAALTVGGLSGIGMWLLLDRNLVRVVLGIVVLGNAINLSMLTSGRYFGNAAPFVSADFVPPDGVNALPQALVLTAIVIGFGLFVFAVSVLKSVREAHGITTTDKVTAVTEEPAPDGRSDEERKADEDVREHIAQEAGR